MGLDWGAVPDWLSGVGTVLAVIFAASAARAAIRANRQQSIQLEQLEQQSAEARNDRARAQAGRIAAWVVPDSSLLPRVYFRNGSDLPIYDVTIACHGDTGVAGLCYPVRGPDDAPVILSRATAALREHGDATGVHTAQEWSPLLDSGRLTVAMCFMDSNGRWWTRDVTGRLEPAPDGITARAHRDVRLADD